MTDKAETKPEVLWVVYVSLRRTVRVVSQRIIAENDFNYTIQAYEHQTTAVPRSCVGVVSPGRCYAYTREHAVLLAIEQQNINLAEAKMRLSFLEMLRDCPDAEEAGLR